MTAALSKAGKRKPGMAHEFRLCASRFDAKRRISRISPTRILRRQPASPYQVRIGERARDFEPVQVIRQSAETG